MARAPKKTAGAGALVKWDQELEKYAQQVKQQEKHISGGAFFSFRSGVLKFNDAPIKGNEMDVVIIDHVLENTRYEGDFDVDNPQAPVCYSFGRDEADMVPHVEAEKPQATSCAECRWNAFGTGDKGKGKGCKNTRRIAVIHADSLMGDDLKNAEVGYIKLPVTSVKGWAAYVRQVADVLKRPPWAVVTKVSLVPDAKTQFKVAFEFVDRIDDPARLGQLRDLSEAQAKVIEFPYAKNAELEQPAAKASKKKVGRRKF